MFVCCGRTLLCVLLADYGGRGLCCLVVFVDYGSLVMVGDYCRVSWL